MASPHAQRVEALVAQARELVEEISQDGRQAVAGAEAEADANVARYRELADERAALAAEDEALAMELERLPVEHSRAQLEDDVERELEIKDRFGDIKDRRSEISARLPAIEAETKSLAPRGDAHPREVDLAQYAAVNRAASGPLVELRRLGSAVHDLAEKEAEFFEGTIRERVGESQGWRSEIDWTEESRQRLRGSVNLPAENRTRTITADPERLAGRGTEGG